MRAYLVMDTIDNGPLYQADDRVLWACGKRRAATLFPTERAAKRAVKLSLDHAAENGYEWTSREYAVVSVELPERRPERRPSRARLLGAVRWALGESGDFPPRYAGDGVYYWRAELGRRAGRR